MLGSFASLSGAFVATSSSAILNPIKIKRLICCGERRCSCLTCESKIYEYGKCGAKPLYALLNNAST